MTQSSWSFSDGPLRGVYRDPENAWIFGVCAGVADRFDVPVTAVRVIAVISWILMFWLTTAIYIAATLVLREKPLIYAGRRSEAEFWRRRGNDDWRRT